MNTFIDTFIDTIIIGCGPSGLQLGYFLNQIKQDYLILEKHDTPGSFFSKYPHSKELISINKIHTGKKNKEFNLRHDWNSLLNNFDIEMKEFSTEFYPSRDDLTKYLSAFASKHNINIQYNTTINHISKNNNLFILKSHNHTWTCNKLIIATGLSKPNIPNNVVNIQQYSKHYSDFPKDYFLDTTNLHKYKNKKVLIFGLGNSAFELANILTPYCSSIILLGRNHTPTPSFSTHYIGDLRSKYFHFYDTFLLKSLNAFDSIRNINICIHKDTNNLYYLKRTCDCDCDYYRTPNPGFHEIINCTGWTFDTSIFDTDLQPNISNKYPEINGKYESTNIPNLFFIGSLMHSFDYKKSSGGFIHGFRYLIDNFVKINYLNFTPLQFNNLSQLTSHSYKRINISSALYQMHGQLCDVFYLDDNQFTYYEQIPLSHLFTFNSKIYLPNTHIFILTLEYGDNLESDLRIIGSRPTFIGTESKAILLHPVLRIYNNKYNDLNSNTLFYPSYTSLKNKSSLVDIIHFDEDLLTDFTNKEVYLEKLFKILKGYF
jgi:thioredoxin reductase